MARWLNERVGVRLRLENRTNAIEHANVVAANILGKDRPYPYTPVTSGQEPRPVTASLPPTPLRAAS